MGRAVGACALDHDRRWPRLASPRLTPKFEDGLSALVVFLGHVVDATKRDWHGAWVPRCPNWNAHEILLLFSLALLIYSLANAACGEVQQKFELSSKVYTMDFSLGRFSGWVHQFGNVFCLPLPPDPNVKEISSSLYNNGIYFSHIAYRDPTVLYVVTSIVPAGRSDEEELGNMAASNQIGVDTYPDLYKQFRRTGLLGPSLVLVVRNARQGKRDLPFPLVRNALNFSNGQLISLSVHRLFVWGGRRIELAGLRYFNAPVNSDREAEVVADLSAFVETAADPLQSCTANLPRGAHQ